MFKNDNVYVRKSEAQRRLNQATLLRQTPRSRQKRVWSHRLRLMLAARGERPRRRVASQPTRLII